MNTPCLLASAHPKARHRFCTLPLIFWRHIPWPTPPVLRIATQAVRCFKGFFSPLPQPWRLQLIRRRGPEHGILEADEVLGAGIFVLAVLASGHVSSLGTGGDEEARIVDGTVLVVSLEMLVDLAEDLAERAAVLEREASLAPPFDPLGLLVENGPVGDVSEADDAGLLLGADGNGQEESTRVFFWWARVSQRDSHIRTVTRRPEW